MPAPAKPIVGCPQATGYKTGYECDLILIRVLRLASYPQDPTCHLHQDAPLETATNRSEPMDCGPNVDQTRMAQQPVHRVRGCPALGEGQKRPTRGVRQGRSLYR